MIFGVAPQTPLMLKQAEIKFPNQPLKASDLVSSVYTINDAFGLLLGPVYGGYSKYLFGFRT